MRSRAAWAGRATALLAVPLAVFLTVLFGWPVVRLLALSFGEGTFTWDNYVRIATVPVYRVALGETFEIAALTTLLCVLCGFPLAYLMAAVGTRTRNVLIAVVLLPFWTSALVRTTAWIVLLQRNGVLNSLLVGSHLTAQPVAFVYNLSGVLIGMTHVLLPFVVLPLYASFRSIDPALLRAAESLGAGPFTVLRRVLVPLTRSGTLAGATIVFMSALGYYVTPSLMGGAAQTMVAQLIERSINTELDWPRASALSTVLLGATLLVFAIFQTAFGVDRLITPAAGRGGDLAAIERRNPARRRLLAAPALLVVVFLIAPILIVFPISIGSSPFMAFPPEHFTLDWYSALFERPQWGRALANSLIVAAIAVPIATLLGTAAAIGLQGMSPRWRRLAETAFVLPMIVPPIIFGVGLTYLLAPLGMLSGPWGVALGHAVMASPLVMLTVRATLQGFDPILARAAQTLGARWLTMFRRVMLPLLWPGIGAGAVFAFVTSFDDVVLATFLTNLRSRTLPKLMYEGVAHQLDPSITAAAALLILATVVGMAASMRRR